MLLLKVALSLTLEELLCRPELDQVKRSFIKQSFSSVQPRSNATQPSESLCARHLLRASSRRRLDPDSGTLRGRSCSLHGGAITRASHSL